MKKLMIILVCVGYWGVTGCAAVIVGAGAGAGTFAYIDGELKRNYKAKYEKTYRVCVSILNDLSQPITEEKQTASRRPYKPNDRMEHP